MANGREQHHEPRAEGETASAAGGETSPPTRPEASTRENPARTAGIPAEQPGEAQEGKEEPKP